MFYALVVTSGPKQAMDIMEWVGTVRLGAFICNQSFGSHPKAKFPPACTKGHIPALAWITRSDEGYSKGNEAQSQQQLLPPQFHILPFS